MTVPFLIDIENELQCLLCRKTFPRKFDLHRHTQNTHGRAIECNLCHKKLKSGNRKDMRIRHLLLGCLVFKSQYLNESPDKLQEKAKQIADECFGIQSP